ncbi:hypothetical protein MKW92_045546 [Papaver armeniacum]|nr:hypothetical protein MKW92_045546 [Papaver armeniacum]
MESERNFRNSEESKQTISENGDLRNEKKLKKKRSLISRFEKPYMEMESVTSEDGRPPSHLVVMVNGILGRLQNLKRYPKEFLVHWREISIRLADEAQFFKPEHNLSEGNGDRSGDGIGSACLEKKSIVKVARLEPMNFITVAAPHLKRAYTGN